MAEMKTILDLVRTGRLGDATDKIQSLLRGSPTGTFQEEMPMRDVTPVSRVLPDGAPSPKPRRGKAVRPRRAVADTGMVRETGLLPYRLFSPSTPSDDAPLIVMLHGCTQTPEDFAAGTRMNAAAEAIGAHVIWPEQSRAANANGGSCRRGCGDRIDRRRRACPDRWNPQGSRCRIVSRGRDGRHSGCALS